MTKRFCDSCGKEIGHYDEYYLEETRAMNLIVSANKTVSDSIHLRRDLCRSCVPEAALIKTEESR